MAMRGGNRNNNGNGNGNGRGRGGSFNYGQGRFGTGPSNSLQITVSDIRQPVTEDVMQRVFQSVGVAAAGLSISSGANETVVFAQFPDTGSAEQVMNSLNNRNIFNGGNKMAMEFCRPPPIEPMGMATGGVLPTPGGMMVPPPVSLSPPPMQQQQMMMPGAIYQQPPQQGYAPMPNGMPYQQQMMPAAPMGYPMAAMNGAAYPQQMGQGMRGNGRGGVPRGARGGRGGRQGAMNGAPFNMFQQMPFPGQPMMGYPPMMGMPPAGSEPTVYLSVTSVPMTEPLMSIYTLLEAYGGVVNIRRNHNKKEILTVKMSSIEDADTVVRFLRRVPFADGTVSAKKFPTYVERTPCTDDGDPMDPEVVQFDFTATRHRSPGQRSKFMPSSLLRITGCSGYSEAELMTYFNTKNFFPERISKDAEGNFTVQVADAETSVKLLTACHGNICGEERSNVIFMEAPKEVPANEADGAAVEEEEQQQQQLQLQQQTSVEA